MPLGSDPPASADDLFGNGPEDNRGADSQAKSKCAACGEPYRAADEPKFCSGCGAPIDGSAAAASNGIPVLLAEDAAITRRKISLILERLGCQVIEAVNGHEAIGQAERLRPALIILDIHMPGRDGLEVLDHLRSQEDFASTPIVMLTAEADAKVVRDALIRRATDYIRKDSTVTELQERLAKHVRPLQGR